ncbi:hypothetical protein CRG98_018013 [Punica granatum]|uniref:Uncharacterized protein n=1 Tax=Punica granatum TaxID=22663 RepID=A0A2I0JZ26_PUNGR|nr:hypothetical protein CRG98_018013 [Punica granatum]
MAVLTNRNPFRLTSSLSSMLLCTSRRLGCLRMHHPLPLLPRDLHGQLRGTNDGFDGTSKVLVTYMIELVRSVGPTDSAGLGATAKIAKFATMTEIAIIVLVMEVASIDKLRQAVEGKAASSTSSLLVVDKPMARLSS